MAREAKLGPSCFAPVLTDEKLAEYGLLFAAVDPKSQLGEVLDNLLKCCLKWWVMPVSGRTDGETLRVLRADTGATQDVKVLPLQDDHAAELDPHLPWDSEYPMIDALLDTISPTEQKPLRDAAYHLLWHVKELGIGREPLTADRLAV